MTPDQPTATATPTPDCWDKIRMLQTAIERSKRQRIGTYMFTPDNGASYAVPDEWATVKIIEQYGADSEIAKTFPHCDNATASVYGGVLKWIEARIAGDTATATPRTDRAIRAEDTGPFGCAMSHGEIMERRADFARTLERELSSAQAALAEAKAEVARLQFSITTGAIDMAALRARVAELQRLLGEVYRNTNLRHHPELTGLADIVSKQLST